MFPLTELWLAILAFGAAVINGAVGYGFSSTVTPVALLWYSNKVLNPALVSVEVGVNLTLLLRERAYVRRTWSHARPVVLTLLPGVVLGTLGLTFLAVNDVKLIVYLILLPLIALQLFGISRPVSSSRGGAAIGPGIGFLYALTTISGPPLALFLRNQGLSKSEFRATIAQIRLAESSLTLATYAQVSDWFGAQLLGLPAATLLPPLILPVLVGVPLGSWLLSTVTPELFRRLAMSTDALFVSYGLSVVLVQVRWVPSSYALTVRILMLLAAALASVVAIRRLRPEDRELLTPLPGAVPLASDSPPRNGP